MGTDHRKPLDILFLASQVTLSVVTIPAFIPRPVQVIAFAVVGWYSYRAIFTQTTGDYGYDFGLGSAILSHYMVALDYALLTPPNKTRNLHDKDRTMVTQRPLKKRVIWALELLSNPRCIGWTDEAPQLPSRPSPSTPRSRFVFARIFLATCCFLTVGGTARYFSAADAGTITGGKLVTGAPHQRVLELVSFGLGAVCVISGFNAIISAGAVGCGLSSPERWPLLFGSPLQVWSIRRFWRRFWHQMIRRHILTCTSSILGCIFPSNYVGTTSHKLARLYIAFFISGFVHIGGDVMASGKLSFKSFTFFMLQPFGITIEVVVSYLWNRFQGDESDAKKTTADEGTLHIEKAQQEHRNNHISNQNARSLVEEPTPPLWIRCVGYIWVTIWMLWTATYMADALLSARLLSEKAGQT